MGNSDIWKKFPVESVLVLWQKKSIEDVLASHEVLLMPPFRGFLAMSNWKGLLGQTHR